jgi:hypothetical protein
MLDRESQSLCRLFPCFWISQRPYFLFIYYAVISTEYKTWKGAIISEHRSRNYKSWPNLRYYFSICLEGLKKLMKNLDKVSRGSNRAPPKYKFRVLPLHQPAHWNYRCTYIIHNLVKHQHTFRTTTGLTSAIFSLIDVLCCWNIQFQFSYAKFPPCWICGTHSSDFRNVMPCIPVEVCRRFVGTYCLYRLSLSASQASPSIACWLLLAGYLLGFYSSTLMTEAFPWNADELYTGLHGATSQEHKLLIIAWRTSYTIRCVFATSMLIYVAAQQEVT